MRVDWIFQLAEVINEGDDFLLHNRKILDRTIEAVHGLGPSMNQRIGSAHVSTDDYNRGLQRDALQLAGGLAAAVMNPSPSPKPRRRHRQPPKNLASEPVGWAIRCATGFSPALPLWRVQ